MNITGTSATPNDLLFPKQWDMADINVQAAWNAGLLGDKSVKVCVIDTGADYTHPDLAANVWVNPGEIPGNGIDDDNNGEFQQGLFRVSVF